MMKTLVCNAPAALVVLVCSQFMFTASAANEVRKVEEDRAAQREAVEKVERRETDSELLGTRAGDLISHASNRMADSARRLGKELDAGKETQVIQQRIMEDLEKLIEEAKKPQKSPPPPKGGLVGPAGEKKPEGPPMGQQAGPMPSPADTAAEKSEVKAGEKPSGTRTEFKETREVFMRISPRVIPAVIEGSTEKIPSKYEKMTHDYYRGVAQAGR